MSQRKPSVLVALFFTAVLMATANSATRAQEALDAAIGRTISVVPRVGNIGITPDGKIVAVVTHDQTVMFFETDTGKKLGETPRLEFNSGNGLHLEFSPDSQLVACRDGYDSTIRIWGAKTGKEHATVRIGTARVRRFIFSPDSTSLLVASGNEAVLWGLATKTPIKTLRRPEDPYRDDIHSLLFLPDGKSVVTGGGDFDKTARLWDLDSEKELQGFGNHQQAVSQLACSPDGTRLVTLSSFEVRVFDLREGEELKRTTVRHRGGIRFTADAEFVVISEGYGPQEVLDSQTLEAFSFGQIVERKHLLGAGVQKPLPEHAVAFSEDGRWVAFAQGSRTATHFFMLSGLSRPIGVLPITATCGYGFQLTFSRNGKKLALKRADDEIAVLNCEAFAEAVEKEAAARAEEQRLAQIERDRIAAKEAEEMRLRQAEAERLAAMERERAAKEAEAMRAKKAEEERLAALERERVAKEAETMRAKQTEEERLALANRERMARGADAMRARKAEEDRPAPSVPDTSPGWALQTVIRALETEEILRGRVTDLSLMRKAYESGVPTFVGVDGVTKHYAREMGMVTVDWAEREAEPVCGDGTLDVVTVLVLDAEGARTGTVAKSVNLAPMFVIDGVTIGIELVVVSRATAKPSEAARDYLFGKIILHEHEFGEPKPRLGIKPKTLVELWSKTNGKRISVDEWRTRGRQNDSINIYGPLLYEVLAASPEYLLIGERKVTLPKVFREGCLELCEKVLEVRKADGQANPPRMLRPMPEEGSGYR